MSHEPQFENAVVPDSLIPSNDQDRLKALYRYEILDTPTEAFFDRITDFARKVFEVSSAFISLVDLDRVWYKSNLSGLTVSSVKREDSLCSITILENKGVTVFSDAQQVPRLLSSPYVKAKGGIRFYAGAPLTTHDGLNLGTVCVVDDKPRAITEKEKEVLQDLAKLVVEQLELRAASLRAVRKHDELHAATVTEILQPMEQLAETLQEAVKDPLLPSTSKALLTEAAESSQNILHYTQALLLESTQADEPFLLHPEPTSIAEIARSTVQELEPVAAEKQQDIYFMVATGRVLRVDPALMQQAFSNLIRFGISYSPPASFIALDIFEADNLLHIEFTYDRIHLSDQDLKKLFLRYAKLSIVTTGNEALSGEELAQAKKIIEQHKGNIFAKCLEHGKSCKVVIEFPIS
ncbi:GAF domain-containing sensor histidine kinase [Rufibacter hautae]|uniref:GAF domain-containing sensor histidine kinase n=1 Tax=Rufibacter hautae TaxID=2595005 RepID=A0A5B6TD48_9BACT|nr:GAF domain-containing sensor histidine kinase [Rufibacter hautae]KAA3436909.1 GAF domain-containing sensor histidine kinase [Rufibacter hautae]